MDKFIRKFKTYCLKLPPVRTRIVVRDTACGRAQGMATRGSAGPATTHYIIGPSAKGNATVTMRSGLTIISKDFDLYSQNQMKPVCMTETHGGL